MVVSTKGIRNPVDIFITTGTIAFRSIHYEHISYSKYESMRDKQKL
jgi:hypothetical protein